MTCVAATGAAGGGATGTLGKADDGAGAADMGGTMIVGSGVAKGALGGAKLGAATGEATGRGAGAGGARGAAAGEGTGIVAAKGAGAGAGGGIGGLVGGAKFATGAAIGTGGAAGFGTMAVGASPKANPVPGAGSLGEAGTGGMGAGVGSDPKGRVTDIMFFAEFGGLMSWLLNTFEVGGLIAEGAIMGAAALGARGGRTLPEVAPGFGGSEIRMVSFLILPWVILSEGLGKGAVGGGASRLLGAAIEAGGIGGAAGLGAGWAAAESEEPMAMVCLGSDMPAGISGFWVILFGGATGSLAPAGMFGLGGGGGGTAILGRLCRTLSDRQSY